MKKIALGGLIGGIILFFIVYKTIIILLILLLMASGGIWLLYKKGLIPDSFYLFKKKGNKQNAE